MNASHLFNKKGAHVIVDGQFGSTGKGAFSKWLADQAMDQEWFPDVVVSNAGPNSGHTFYDNIGEKHVLKQLPTFAVAMLVDYGVNIPVFLSAGAAINPGILFDEMDKYPELHVWVHPNAVYINHEDIVSEHSGSVAAVAGTASGTGAAIARKVLRAPDAVVGYDFPLRMNLHIGVDPAWSDWKDVAAVVEVSQGFSLGINSQFYPKVTSRECTVMQAMADARMPPSFHSKTYMVIRTFPIRVGNHNGHSSGDCYPDQLETTWDTVGVAPELTTVTKRERRIFTFSYQQYDEAFDANDPDFVFINFLNYLNPEAQEMFITSLTGDDTKGFIGGYGPKSRDIKWLSS